MAEDKHCTVAFALPGEQFLWTVAAPAEATVSQLIGLAHAQAAALGQAGQVPWETDAVGIFGEPCRRDDVPRDGDRVELYRSLINDPRASRRARLKGR